MMKRPLYFLSCMALAALFSSCEEATELESQCSQHAIVEDWTELDGCGMLLKLDDGEYLEPVFRFYCGTPPLPEDHQPAPEWNFPLEDGMEVMIDYEVVEGGSICMKGTLVSLTCLSKVSDGQGGESDL